MVNGDRGTAYHITTDTLDPPAEAISMSAPLKKAHVGDLEEVSPPTVTDETADVPVVALGASSGGLKALELFFKNVPPGNGMAFILAMHLSPEHKSRLAEILQSFTTMPVIQMSTDVDIEPDHVYVISPRQHLALQEGRLHVSSRGRSPAFGVIDHLFESVAASQQERAVGIVFSGSGVDGTAGLRAINELGGLVLAQDPEEAESAAMPNSVIATGLVDYILPAAEIPARLMELRGRASRPVVPMENRARLGDERALRDIFMRLREHSGHDFTHYKRTSLNRHLDRRMLIQHVEDLPTYVRRLQTDKAEVDTLFRNLLVGVTQFFRDPEAFQALESDVLPNLFKEADETSESPGVRVWVPGCATGEEAYSLAMLMAEHRDAVGSQASIQVLATDINDRAISVARRGLYAHTIAKGLSTERLHRFFQRREDDYQVSEDLREMVLFAEHDLTQDPPFGRMDLISCRNLLIYFDVEMQRCVLERFAYSLRSGGYLLLGTSEGAGRASEFFAPVSKKFSLFQRKVSTGSSPHRQVFSGPSGGQEAKAASSAGPERHAVDYPAPEDVQSLNEELRAVMEEHEVSKEELQSLNEELTTVNQELQNKIEEHRRLNSDLHNLIQSTRMATLFLDQRLNVLLYTPECTKLFNLLSIDIGRPLEHLTHKLKFDGVLQDARQVLEEGPEVEREVQTKDGSWYFMRIMPYQTTEGEAGGVVLTFADITLQKEMERVSEHRFTLAFHAGPMAASIITRDEGLFLDVNEIFEEITGYSRDEVVGHPARTFGLPFGGEADASSTKSPGNPTPSQTEIRIHTRSGGIRDLIVSLTPIDFGGQPCFLRLFYDVTERKRLEQEILVVSDREQRRIGVDLHDGLGTHLTGIAMMTRGLARNLRTGRPVTAEEVDEIARLVADGIEQARTLAQGLNPFLLDEYGLTVALQALAANMQAQSEIECSFEDEGGSMSLSNEQSIHLYRITQEAVTNAARHGHADRIRIVLSEKNRHYLLTIQDDGTGFELAKGHDSGMGLHIMRYRADMIGARLDITSTPGDGTTVTCTFDAADRHQRDVRPQSPNKSRFPRSHEV